MLTDFGSARMTRYTQAFLQTTRRDAKASTVRWIAYELISHDVELNEQDETSSDDEDNLEERATELFSQDVQPSRQSETSNNAEDNRAEGPVETVAMSGIRITRSSNMNLLDSDQDGGRNIHSLSSSVSNESDAAEEDEDEGRHTQESDMWAFGMVIYRWVTKVTVIVTNHVK